MEPIIEIKNVTKIYKVGNERITALDGINLEINKGEFLALNEGALVDVSADRVETTVKLIEKLCEGGEELVTIYYGEGVDPDETDELSKICEERLGDDVDVNVVYGGQPVYYYIISAE